MPIDTTSNVGPRRWLYGADGHSASRIAGSGVAALLGEAQSGRQSPSRMFGPPDWQYWMTTLKFRVKTERFSSEFDVERQNIVRTSDRPGSTPYFCIVWKLDYATVQVSLGGNDSGEVANLPYKDWLDFDMQVQALLSDWPHRADETPWLGDRRIVDRVVFTLGGHIGGEWDRHLVRTCDGMWVPPSASKLRRVQHGLELPLPRKESGWQQAPGLPGISNQLTKSSLTYDGIFVPAERGGRRHYLFSYEHLGDDRLPIPVIIPDKYEPPVWTVILPHALLMSCGWTLDEIWAVRTSEDSAAQRRVLEGVVPTDPLTAAEMINGIIDALLHWRSIDKFGPASPEAVAIQAITDDSSFWPFCNVSASLHQRYFKVL